jgi:hypothetical protein
MIAFQEFLETWHIQYHFPEHVPTSISYPLMVSLLNKEAWYLPGGYICYDFCTGYAPECDLKEYCPCLRIWESEKVRK